MLSKLKVLSMLSLLLVILSCIPREDPPEKVLTLDHIYDLPQLLNENSGMIEYNNLIWLISDSGNDSVLYGYDRHQNLVVRTVAVRNSTNTDWEDITQNSRYIFIGDFGNNAFGNRTDLRIYVIDKNDLNTGNDTVTAAGVISFSYEDQTDFTPATENNTPFDCEAFIATEDSLLLFTKDWQNARTKIYTLPALSGSYIADLRKQLGVEGYITAAAWSGAAGELYLLGYTAIVTPFLWVYSGFNTQTMNYTGAERTDFSFPGTQAEGLLISGDGSILISSEEFVRFNPPHEAGLYVVVER